MADGAKEEAFHDDMDHCLGDSRSVARSPGGVSGPSSRKCVRPPSDGECLEVWLESMWAPALAKISVAVTLTIRRRPSVSTTIWRLRLTIFFLFLAVVVDFRPRVAGV